jgi:polyisoprenyl-phosphate glycosyltransferase
LSRAMPTDHRCTVSLVIPVFNEADAIEPFLQAIQLPLDALENRGFEFELIFINDGSIDGTLKNLLDASARDHRLRVIDLSRNFGKEAALTAGLDEAAGDAIIPIDVDLQDPPDLIPELIEKWQEGYDVVLVKRSDRSSDSFLKRRTAAWFYNLHNLVAKPPIPEDVGDFRLMDRRVVDALKHLPERRRFMKGLFSWVGFQATTVHCQRRHRVAGQTKYSVWRLWNFALEGITSFSAAPLQIWAYVGAAFAACAFVYMGFIVLRTLLYGIDVPGYASLLSSVLFLGGIQLIGIGVLGEYLGRVYEEVKRRPIYVVRERYPKKG